MKVLNANIAQHKQNVMKLMKNLGFNQNGERYSRCKKCMNNSCLWKDGNTEKQNEYN